MMLKELTVKFDIVLRCLRNAVALKEVHIYTYIKCMYRYST